MHINIDIVKQLLDTESKLRGDFVPYGKVYLTTTENIKGIIENINLQDKKVLSVAGSGDQALNAFVGGAKKVTLFDINPLARAQVELKITAARKLTYEEFCEFFIPELGYILNYSLFSKISRYLKEDVRRYYEFLYSNYTPNEIFYKTIYNFYPNVNQLEHLNNYMQKDNFKKIPTLLEGKQINYIEASLQELPSKLDDTYDVILLSNISDYLEEIWDTNTLKSYKRFIHSLSKKLNKGGTIQCGYVYSNYSRQTKKPLFANTLERQNIFSNNEFKEHKVETYIQTSGLDDTVVIYEKKKRKA